MIERIKRGALFLLPLLLFWGCGKGNASKESFSQWMESDGVLRVLSTTAMIHDLVSQVGGDAVAPLCLMIGDLDPHSYEMVKGDDEKIRAADLIFYNGLGLEHGASLRHHLQSEEKAIGLGDRLYEKNPERLLTVDGEIDPHIWMDMSLFSEIIDPIVDALGKKDPSHQQDFERRGRRLKEKLKIKDALLRRQIERVPIEKRFLVTSHDAFHYFTRRYLASGEEGEFWEERVLAPEGLAPDSQMSVLDIKKVSDYLCKHRVHVVFPESNVSPNSLKKIVSICQKRGLEVEVAEISLYGDAMGGVESYVEMMEHNVNTLTSYLMK